MLKYCTFIVYLFNPILKIIMKKILVPTDFSIYAESALRVAASLAKKHNGEIYLLHMLGLPMDLMSDSDTVPDSFGGGSAGGPPEAMFFMKMAHKRFQEVLSSDFLEGITVHETIQNYRVFEGIIDAAHKNDVDLIVMGSQGASGAKEMIIGSNTEKVVRTSDVPVLVIKKEDETFDINDMVIPCEFTDEYKDSFMKSIAFANDINAKTHLLMVNTPNKFTTTAEAEERMNNFIQGTDLKNYTLNIYNDISIEKGILNFSNTVKADIIAMSTHGRKGLSHFFNGSLSEDLVNHAKRPVITFKM